MPHTSDRHWLRGVLLALLLCSMPMPGTSQSYSNEETRAKDDPYSIELVKTLLNQPEAFSVSWLEKRQERLGDRAAIALLKLLGEQKLMVPLNLRRSLKIIRGAFSAPCLIELSTDRNPTITVLILRDLEQKIKEGDEKRTVGETLTFVQRSTCATAGN